MNTEEGAVRESSPVANDRTKHGECYEPKPVEKRGRAASYTLSLKTTPRLTIEALTQQWMPR